MRGITFVELTQVNGGEISDQDMYYTLGGALITGTCCTICICPLVVCPTTWPWPFVSIAGIMVTGAAVGFLINRWAVEG